MIKITDVRANAGDSAFLLDDGESAILYDTGFAYTGARVAENVGRVLGERRLDAILLTHSHYDHAAGAPYIKRAYPEAQIVAGEYAARIFSKPTARSLMRELDRRAALADGIEAYEDLIDELSVTCTVADGEALSVGRMRIETLSLPGHTKCSVGYYLPEEGLLLSSETLGVFNGTDDVVPAYLVGVKMSLDAISRVKALSPRSILLPHFGVIEGETVERYLSLASTRAEEVARVVSQMLAAHKNKEEIQAWFEREFYHGAIVDCYPIDAMRLNTKIMIDLIERELSNHA